VKVIQNYIDGHFVSGKQNFADITPADGSVIAQVSEASESQVDEAVNAARLALHGEWRGIGVRERAARLHRIADAIEKRWHRSSTCRVPRQTSEFSPISLRPPEWKRFRPKLLIEATL
jgi:acyl-CoA reductase-like NAD-dependent aldehyde dehydrogenase